MFLKFSHGFNNYLLALFSKIKCHEIPFYAVSWIHKVITTLLLTYIFLNRLTRVIISKGKPFSIICFKFSNKKHLCWLKWILSQTSLRPFCSCRCEQRIKQAKVLPKNSPNTLERDQERVPNSTYVYVKIFDRDNEKLCFTEAHCSWSPMIALEYRRELEESNAREASSGEDNVTRVETAHYSWFQCNSVSANSRMQQEERGVSRAKL